MKISRQDYDRQPFAIRAGALLLWGTPLIGRFRDGHYQQLYSFNNFYAEMYYEEESQQLTSISTFEKTHRLEAYLESLSLSALLE
ncbi:hypothetical protein HNV11_09790 [Spirosoma taeanense]|uniref:Uncharacterized protein n=1 Tax=Spirosoma taeanense TaxID=2735870 RepID=A0A6M5Y9Z6_9BACT|nr:hypothetical protein [Spirosoma taeanense]QJW89652.1 hypothetical protein HNV11_09790 [Spirosoma taeanense]